MKNLFDFRESSYNIRNFQEMRQQKRRTVRYGLETMRYGLETMRYGLETMRYGFETMRYGLETMRYGLETALYRAPQLWSLVPTDLK